MYSKSIDVGNEWPTLIEFELVVYFYIIQVCYMYTSPIMQYVLYLQGWRLVVIVVAVVSVSYEVVVVVVVVY